MKVLIEKFSNRRLITFLGILLLANLLLFSIPGLPGSRASILASAPDQQIPDMMGIYSPKAVYDFLSAIGPSGREAYQWMHYTSDLTFPLVYGLFLFSWLCRLVVGKDSKLHYVPFIAVLASAADLAENFSMVSITDRFPVYLQGLTRLAQVFSLMKFLGIGVCGVIGLILVVNNNREKKKDRTTSI